MTITVVATVKDENGINLMILLNYSSQGFIALRKTVAYFLKNS